MNAHLKCEEHNLLGCCASRDAKPCGKQRIYVLILCVDVCACVCVFLVHIFPKMLKSTTKI